MDSLTILMIAHNELPYVRVAVDSIRELGDIEDLELVVADNASSDGLREWAQEQEDFTYVWMEQGAEPCGKIINEVNRELKPTGDLLIMEAHYLIAPGCLSRLCAALYEDESVGAVGGVANTFSYYQKLPEDLTSYEKAAEYAIGLEPEGSKQVLGLCPNVILFRKKALEELGPFEEQLFGCPEVMKDYLFRLINGDYKLEVCREAVFWDLVKPEAYYSYTNRFYRSSDESILEAKWKMHYFNYHCNESLIDFIRADADSEISVLEIGCDCGATLLEIKNRFPNAEVYGCELNEAAANIASHVAKVIVRNIENRDMPYERHMFDYIIFGDVLEHLHAPDKTIEYCADLLKPGGSIIASIPNLMHISVMEQILRGDFTYTETGLLDKTHIHLFTYNEILRMFRRAGYVVQEAVMRGGNLITPEQSGLIDRLMLLGKAERFMYEAFQYVIRAQVSEDTQK